MLLTEGDTLAFCKQSETSSFARGLDPGYHLSALLLNVFGCDGLFQVLLKNVCKYEIECFEQSVEPCALCVSAHDLTYQSPLIVKARGSCKLCELLHERDAVHTTVIPIRLRANNSTRTLCQFDQCTPLVPSRYLLGTANRDHLCQHCDIALR